MYYILKLFISSNSYVIMHLHISEIHYRWLHYTNNISSVRRK